MSVTRGNKGSCPTNDQSLVGVYQNGTYTISDSAKIESGSSTQNNSIYLPSGKYVNQSGAIRNTFLITTATNDRKVGRELVQNSGQTYESKYKLAYGNKGVKANTYAMKDDDGVSFTGDAGAITSDCAGAWSLLMFVCVYS